MSAPRLTPATHKVSIRPLHKTRWAAGAERIVSTTYIATVSTSDGLKAQDCCDRPYGHKTIETATKCGLATFIRLEKQGAKQ